VTSDNQTPAALPVLPPEDSVKALADLGKKAGKEEKTAESPSAKTQTVAKSSEVAAAKTTPDTAKKSGAPTGHEAKKPKGPTQAKPDADPSLASKLNFQNSLDTPTHKQSKTGAKKEGAAHTASVVAPSSQTPKESAAGTEKKTVCAYQVKVASYRTSEEAEKALADLKKKGFKVSLQQGKDTSGNTFTIKTGRYNTKSEAEKVTQKLKEAKINGQIQELKQ
jgi:cell division septation protein DedD